MSSHGLWLSAAGMKVSEHRQTLLANNMANVETTGFKHDLAVVTQRRIESRSNPNATRFAHSTLDDLPGGPQVQPPYHDLSQGPMDRTGRALDAAIQGEGFFEVSDGEVTRYTRDGSFGMAPAGELVLTTGDGRWKVLDSEHQPIVLSEEAGKPELLSDGTIRQGASVSGELALVTAEDTRSLRKIGENLFESGAAEMRPAKGRLVPGSLELSNFDIMSGLAQMIEAGRVYEMNATMIRLQDDATGQVISRVGATA